MFDKRKLQLRPRIFLLLLVQKSGDHHQNASMKPVGKDGINYKPTGAGCGPS